MHHALCYVILICNFVLALYKTLTLINNKLFVDFLQYYVKMFRDVLSFLKKSVKNVIIKKISYESFSSMCIVYDSFFWNLALASILALHCYCGDNIKNRLLSKHLIQRKR